MLTWRIKPLEQDGGSLSRQRQGPHVQGSPQQIFSWAWRPLNHRVLTPNCPLSSVTSPAHAWSMATHLLQMHTKHVLTASHGYQILSCAAISASFLLTTCKYFICVHCGEHCSRNRPERGTLQWYKSSTQHRNQRIDIQTVPMAPLYTARATWGSLQNCLKLPPGELKLFSVFWCQGPVSFNSS